MKEDLFYTNINRFARKCQQRLDEISDEEYFVIEVEDARGMVKDLADIIQHSVGVQGYDNLWLPSACVLLDKLRVGLTTEKYKY